jgi:CRISPR-associated Cas5-like protein
MGIKMKVIRADLEVPFWCSFSEYGTVNIRPTYPFPPPTTLFGLIQNALQKPALHDLTEEERKVIAPQYLENYSKLYFAIIIQENGEKIDDYLNIHKGSREIEGFESSLKYELQKKLDELDLIEDDKKS